MVTITGYSKANLAIVLDKLSKVRKQGSGYIALCPAHDDHKHSLSINIADDGKILLHCHTGCSLDSILAAIGLSLQDLFPSNSDSGKREIVAIYDYETGGKLHHQTIRYSDKSFSQRRPDGNGNWIWKEVFKDITPVLYHLAQVLEAIKNGQTVYIVEGEKDADNLAKLGLTATTNPMGAGKWRDHYADTLKDADVVILPDNDEPGQKHAREVANSLHGKAKSVRVLELPELPPKGDVSDYLRAGGTKEELLSLTQSAPEWDKASSPSQHISNSDVMTLSLRRLCDVSEPEPMTFIVEDFVPENYPTMFYGDGGQGKSYIILSLASCVVTGRPFLNKTVCQGNVLYVDFELDEHEQARRAYKVARGLGLEKPPEGLYYFSPTTQEHAVSNLNAIIDALVKQIEQHDIALTIVDSFGAAVSGDPESARDVTALFQRLRKLGTVIILDHQSKTTSGERYKDKTAFGSVYKSNLSRNIWQLQRLPETDGPDNEVKLALHHKKSNFGPMRETVCLKATFSDAFTVEQIEPDIDFGEVLSTKDKVLVAFMELGKATADEVAEETGEKIGTVKNKITALKKEGKLLETGAKKGQAHVYKSVITSQPYIGSDGDDAFSSVNLLASQISSDGDGDTVASPYEINEEGRYVY